MHWELSTLDVQKTGDILSRWTLDNGLAVVLLFIGIAAVLYVVVYQGRKVFLWVGTNIILPLKDAAITHLATTDTAMKTTSSTMKEMQTTFMGIHEEIKASRAANEAATLTIHKRFDELRGCVKRDGQ